MMDQEVNPKILVNLRQLQDCAREGHRILWQPTGAEKPKTIWGGLGNRAGLHSYAYEILDEKWTKSGERFTGKVTRILEGEMGPGQILIQGYRAKTRDRGNWRTLLGITV